MNFTHVFPPNPKIYINNCKSYRKLGSMTCTRMRNQNLLLYIIILASCSIVHVAAFCVLTARYEVQVFNELSPTSSPLLLHCASRNDDIGQHILYANQNLKWHFCGRLFGRTLFFCHLWWGSKYQAFDVFNSGWANFCFHGICTWEAKSDGIYFQYESGLKKIYDWK